ncbi:MAG: response regulator [Planctomycetota bacterium]|nr:MAG: response regulator [Planctomycetota bacterium]
MNQPPNRPPQRCAAPRPLRVLVIEPDPRAALSTSAALGARGHRALRVARANWAADTKHADVALVPLELCDGDGIALAESLARRLPVVMSTSRIDAALCVRAMRAGVRDLVERPCSAEELCAVLERSAAPTTARGHAQFSLNVAPDAASIERGVRELVAWALVQGVDTAARARLGGAAHELLDNASRHADCGAEGVILVRARLERSALELSVLDHGRGFDAAAVLSSEGALPAHATSGGLARCAALCDDFACRSTANGTLVELRFELAETSFAEDAYAALSERDWLAPAHARRALQMARQGRAGDALNLSPALAVAIGRLLAGGSSERLRQAALWSA